MAGNREKAVLLKCARCSKICGCRPVNGEESKFCYQTCTRACPAKGILIEDDTMLGNLMLSGTEAADVAIEIMDVCNSCFYTLKERGMR